MAYGGLKKKIPLQYHGWLAAGASEIDPREAAGISWRGVLIGAVLAFLLNYMDAYATSLVRASFLTLNFSTPAALFFFFFSVLASGLVHLIRRPLALSQTELATIYFMLLVACCIPGMGFTQFIIPSLVGSTYYASPENNWDTLYNQHIPRWMIPQGDEVSLYFFEGLPPDVAIPWGAWVVPLTFWYGFFLILSLVMICTMVILRKQWVDQEKLVYPLVQVPMEMIQQDRSGIIGRPFFTNKVMWAGFALAFISLSFNGLNFYYPSFPLISRNSAFALFGDLGSVSLWFNPAWIGFFYFVNLDISASIWVFYLLAKIEGIVFNVIGLKSEVPLDRYSPDPYLAHQGMGAMIVFVLLGLWLGRGHLKAVFSKAFWNDSAADDSGEMLSYRQAFLGLGIGLFLVGVALWMTGLPALLVPMFIFSAMVLFIGLTRVVAEGGIPAMRPPILSSSFVTSGVGTAVVGTSGLVALGFTYGWHSEIRSFVMASVANGLKMGEIIRGSRRRLFWAALIAILVSLAGSSYMTMYLAYKYGGINLLPLFFGGGASQMGPMDMARHIAAGGVGPRPEAWLFMGFGGSVMALLMWVRYRFLWWSLNPLGYAISVNWKTDHIFFSAFIAWVLKALILRYGGAKLYKGLRSFFFGLILGEIVGAGAWAVIDFFTGRIGNTLTQV